jgi:hypothetical protein
VAPAGGARRRPRRRFVDPFAGVRGPDVATHQALPPG